MARKRFDVGAVGGTALGSDLVTQLGTLTTLITTATAAKATVVSDRTTASETNATVGTAVTAVGTAITAIQTAVTAFSGGVSAPVVVDIDLVAVPDLNTLKRHLNAVLAKAKENGLT